MATVIEAREWLRELGCETKVLDEGKDRGGYDTLTVEALMGNPNPYITMKDPSDVFPAGSLHCAPGCERHQFSDDLTRAAWDKLVAQLVEHKILCIAR